MASLLDSNSIVDELTRAIPVIISERNPKNVAELVSLVKENYPFSEKMILESIHELEHQGKISLKNPASFSARSIIDYLKLRAAFWYWITMVIAVLSIIVIISVPENAIGLSYLRNALGVLFVLWLPGYALIKALFPVKVPLQTSSNELDVIERIVLSLGMSLALTPIIGLVLNYTPWGIRLIPISVSLLLLTSIFATIGLFREYKLKFNPNPTQPQP